MNRADGTGAMFDEIAEHYDVLNRLISMGRDQSWRRRAVASLELKEGARSLDLATGTGDLAIMTAQSKANVEVVAIDPSRGMLDVATQKLDAIGLQERIHLEQGDAQRIEHPDKSFDAVTIAFGIRNVPDRAAALREMARVTRDGGRIAILELSEPKSAFARFHVHQVIPRLGAAISGSSAYRYLQKSIAAFPAPDAFATMMEDAGLSVLSIEPMMFGACCLFVATPRRG